MIPVLQIAKCRCVKTPERYYPNDAGIDFFVPNWSDPVCIWPQQRIKIPSGIHVKIPHGYMLKAEDKSGVGINKGLKYLGGVVDEGYTGEIHICLFNTGKEKVFIYPGEKIIQFILIPVFYAFVELKSSVDEMYKDIDSSRGSGGFGSSGKGNIIWEGLTK